MRRQQRARAAHELHQPAAIEGRWWRRARSGECTPQSTARHPSDRETARWAVSTRHSARRWCMAHTGLAAPPNHGSSPSDRRRLGPAKRGHPIQDTAGKARLGLPTTSTPSAKAIANDGLVAEEGVLHAGLPVVARGFLPLAPAKRCHVGDRAIAGTRARSAGRHPGRPGRRHDHPDVSERFHPSRPTGLRRGR